ncbi:hypothetical protein GCM10010495_41140 [Kitasatospora herbaricolor]|nr:hypothetical protein GCM10010495_41140 [Kitasatospora herbaricolor]
MAVAVDDTGDEAGATGTTGGTLAELGTGLGVKADLGHDCTPRNKNWRGGAGKREKTAGTTPTSTFGGHSAAYDLCQEPAKPA